MIPHLFLWGPDTTQVFLHGADLRKVIKKTLPLKIRQLEAIACRRPYKIAYFARSIRTVHSPPEASPCFAEKLPMFRAKPTLSRLLR